MDKLENQPCPVCRNKTLTLIEDEKEVPYFGKVFLFSMQCSSCSYFMSDVEAEQPKDPCRITFTVDNEKDMNVRIVKSSQAAIKIPQLRMSVEPGPASIGYISNIEGILKRFEEIIEEQKELAEEDSEKKTAKNLLKKLRKVKFGDIQLKIVMEDPTGNSAIISDKSVIEKLKK